MNQEREEEQIKKLFQQLKLDDERCAPSFARMLEPAASRGEKAGWGWPVLRVAIALMLVLVTLAGGWLVFFRQSAGEQIAHPTAPPEVAIPRRPNNDPPQPQIASSGNKPPKVVRRRQASAQRLPLEAMISQWRSPTDFLLKTPGEQWLKGVPQLGVPPMEIKPLVFEQKN